MPSRETVDAFIAQVLSGDHVGAIRDWYAQDASIQENAEPPREGREVLIAGEAQMLERTQTVVTELMAPPLVNGDQVAIHWRFTFTLKGRGSVRVFDEIAWQIWRGEKIWRERFFYDPATTAKREPGA
jgi:hypothetical protein